MDKKSINNQIVSMRRVVKKAKVHTISRLVRSNRKLTKSKGAEEKVTKLKRKAERQAEEILVLKKIPIDDVTKFALTQNEASVMEKTGDSVADAKSRAFRHLAAHPAVVTAVKEFKEKNKEVLLRLPHLFNLWGLQKKNQSNKKVRTKINKSKNVFEDDAEKIISQDVENDAEKIISQDVENDAEKIMSQDVENDAEKIISQDVENDGNDGKLEKEHQNSNKFENTRMSGKKKEKVKKKSKSVIKEAEVDDAVVEGLTRDSLSDENSDIGRSSDDDVDESKPTEDNDEAEVCVKPAKDMEIRRLNLENFSEDEMKMIIDEDKHENSDSNDGNEGIKSSFFLGEDDSDGADETSDLSVMNPVGNRKERRQQKFGDVGYSMTRRPRGRSNFGNRRGRADKFLPSGAKNYYEKTDRQSRFSRGGASNRSRGRPIRERGRGLPRSEYSREAMRIPDAGVKIVQERKQNESGKDSKEQLHPSWAAKQKMKAMSKIPTFEGTKIKFE